MMSQTACFSKPDDAGKLFQRYEVRLTENQREINLARQLWRETMLKKQHTVTGSVELFLKLDEFDHFVKHLIVYDTRTGKVIGYTRVLTSKMAAILGSYSSGTKFDLTRVLSQSEKLIEISHTCVHRDYQRATIIELLWCGIARAMQDFQANFLIGSISLPVVCVDNFSASHFDGLIQNSRIMESCQATPRVPMPRGLRVDFSDHGALVESHFRAGGQMCGEPAWNVSRGTAEILLLLERRNLERCYRRTSVSMGRIKAQDLCRAG